ncbi:hypothetical protein [Nocardioides antri]|uniref:SnoaL-like domain-containing protein n=1 Tax=Nocardioides antri TaxID=2607659 RepID=A0A5B1M110_9ACTN|nr:hypothetical protein [Nocardioides antri]KAA1426138.1 hypothetical protein F0U47_14585 [Nocardioides antri]
MSTLQGLRTATAVLVGAAVAAIATVLVAPPSSVPSPSDRLNVAVVDADATAEVVTAVEDGLGRILVYDYRHPHRAEKPAASFLTGAASEQYQQIYDVLAAVGPRQKLIHRSTVSRVGVQRLTGSSAELLVFLDQETVRTTDGSVNRAPAQIRVEAVRTDDGWRVSSIELL